MLTVGIDHSLTATGVVAVPASWECDFRRVMRVTLETRPTLPIPVRRAAIAADIVAFVRTAVAHYRVPLSSVRVAIEGGIAMRGKLSSIRSQERLAAIIEDRLFADLRLELEIAPQSSARRLFLGPELAGKSGSGATVQALLDRVIPDHATWFEAELDAFLVANFLLAESGEAFVSVAPSERRERVH